MLTKNSVKIDKYYFILSIILVILSFLVIVTLRNIFSSVITMNELDEDVIGSIPLVNEVKLNKAHDAVYKLKIEPLDLRE